jgi:hypothetical protein
MTDTKQADGTLIRRNGDGSLLRFSKDGGIVWSRWYWLRLESLELGVLHGIEVK